MFTYYPRGGGGTSIDPGIAFVLSPADGGPATYEINGVTLTGTATVAHPTAGEIADAIWGANLVDYTGAGTFGLWAQTLLTVKKFLALK